MPKLKTCNTPGCPELTTTSHCVEHTTARRATSDHQRGTATQRGYDHRWRSTRRAYLRTHPICECDDPACTRIANVVHHIDQQGPLGPHGHDPANLQALAKSCHDKITAADNGGWQRVGMDH